jgi:hypothetical protein
MNRLVIFFMLFVASAATFGQTESGWTLLQQKDGVSLEVQYSTCGQQVMVFVRVNNSSARSVVINWKERFVFKGRTVDINSGQVITLKVAASQTLSGSCGNSVTTALSINPDEYVTMAGTGSWELEIYDLLIE